MAIRLRESFVHAPATLRLVFRFAPRLLVILLLLTLAAAASPLGVAYVGKRIIDAVVAGSPGVALRFVGIELLLVVLQASIVRGQSLCRSVLGARLSVDINVLILEKALSLSLRHFEDPDFYDQLTRARRNASSRPLSVVTELLQLGQNILSLCGYVLLLMQFSGWAVLGLLLAALPATVAEMRFSGVAFRLRNFRAPETRRLNYLEYVLANDSHAKEVKLFSLGPMLLQRYRGLGEALYDEDAQLAVRRAVWAYALSLVATAAFYGCYAYMGWLAATGALQLGSLTLYVVAFRQGQQSFQSVLSAIGGMYEDNLYMSNLFQYLAIPQDAPAPPPSLAEDVQADGLRFEAVGFRYPGQERWALRGVSLHIPRGQSLALVGENGAGKTTFIKLLSRLYEPTEGRILLDGKDLRAWDPEALRRRIGVIFQDFNRYQLTAAENVGVGSVDHMSDAERVDRAVDLGGAREVVGALKEGLGTQLGSWFGGGAELSGGQWQKVALSRAFMRQEADILILDEPTAALDAEAEYQVFLRFRELSRGRTTILISHRFPTVRMADRIVVLQEGQILEEGTHQELVARGGRYARLFTLQAEGYR